METNRDTSSPWQRVLGIVGGLGPYAHIELERRLLEAVEPVASEQDYPPWIVSSLPATPDRTGALVDGGPSPVPRLAASLENLAGRADYAVIACITAHAFLDEVRPQSPLPIFDLVEATLREAVKHWGDSARVGLLATTGTLESRLFPLAAERLAPGLELISLLDLPGGEQEQEDLVMAPIYGRLQDGRRSGGIKSGAFVDPGTRLPPSALLNFAVDRLLQEDVDVVLAGCTEIGMELGEGEGLDSHLLDPLNVAVHAALAISRGERPLP